MTSDPNTAVEVSDISRLGPDDLEAHLNTEFTVDPNYYGINADGTPIRRNDVYPPDASVKLKLVEVDRRKPLSEHLRQEPFALLLTGPHETPLYNDTHVLNHDVLGRLLMFLTPVNASPGIPAETHPDGRFYECIVN